MFNAKPFSQVSTEFTGGTSMLPTVSTNVDQMSKMSMADSMKEVFSDIRDGIITTVIAIDDLGSIFSSKISGLNSHLAFRLETLNSTLTTIGKVLTKDFSLDEKTFDEMKEDQTEEDRNKSLDDKEEKKEKPQGLISSVFSDIKGAFSSVIDFFTPKSELAKLGIAGLAVLAVFAFKEQIKEAFKSVLTYIGSLKDAFDEEGFTGVKNKLQKDIKDNVINPTLASVGLRIKEDGTIGLVQGSFLDMANPFGGPTNIFKTLNAFRTGINPYDNNSKMYPEWYYKGFMENLDDLLTPEDPDMLVNAVKKTMNDITEGMSNFFLGEYAYNDEEGLYREQSGMSQMKDQMMENFRNNMQSIADFFHDDQGNLFGIDFKALTDLLPTIQEIAESIYNALPQWARPDTLQEKNIDRDVKKLEDTGFFDKDSIGKSEIDRSKIDQASPNELKSLLSAESDDLRPADIKFIENKIAEKELVQKMIVNNDSIVKTDTLTKVIEQQSELKGSGSGQTISVVADNSQKANVSNYSKTNVNASEFRTDALEMTAFEVHNFYRNRG